MKIGAFSIWSKTTVLLVVVVVVVYIRLVTFAGQQRSTTVQNPDEMDGNNQSIFFSPCVFSVVS